LFKKYENSQKENNNKNKVFQLEQTISKLEKEMEISKE
jgi:hypothetical protein